MKNEFFDFAILLERTLASFYEKILKDERLERIRSTLDFQATHSHEHAIQQAGKNPNVTHKHQN